MLRIEKHIPAPHALAKALLARMPQLELPFAERSKSRLRAMLSNGVEAAIFLERGTVLRGGDALAAMDGSLISVISAPEKVLVVTAREPLLLLRAAYHLGNRHTPVEVGAQHLKIEYDPVLADMLKQLGAHVSERLMPFEPESGAYGGGHKHGHDETFDADYALAQAAYQSHGHDHGHEVHHVHHAEAHDHHHAHDHHDHDHATHVHTHADPAQPPAPAHGHQ
jgi:urease accessory protein